jgi:hypothetical protein
VDPKFLQANVGIVTYRPRPLPSISFSNHYSFIISFDVTSFELLIVLLKPQIKKCAASRGKI